MMPRILEKSPYVATLGALLAVALFGACGCDSTAGVSMVAEISVNPDQVAADGQPRARVSVLVFEDSAERPPLPGVKVEVLSSRNGGGDVVDEIEQPPGSTDAEGLAVAFVGSTTVGSAELTAVANGKPLCERHDQGGCVPISVTVTFYTPCESGLTRCGEDCVDTSSDPENCGVCDNACDPYVHASPGCTMGQCAMGPCDEGWGDCDHDPANGCETDLGSDAQNCGECGRECNDSDVCTQDDTCVDGTCHNENPLPCDDENVCTDDACDPADGCVYTDNTEPCDDDCECTVDDTCADGDCQPGGPLDCDDLNVCTVDACDCVDGCVYTDNTSPCDDSDACTVNDVCADGTCQPGIPRDCDDLNPCTDDSCDPDTGCVHVNNTEPCADGDCCTVDDVCADGACQPGAPRDCDDLDPCTDDSCDPVTCCVYEHNTAACDDGNDCTMNDTCSAGACLGEPLDADGDGYAAEACGYDDCDDGDFDINPGVFEGPMNTPICLDGIDNDCDDLIDVADATCDICNEDANCDDDDVCNGLETCVAEVCLTGTPLDCDDLEVCTDDSCDPAAGCTHVNNNIPCIDGDACTDGDVCEGGACLPGAPLECDDLNLCTDDSCDSASGCVNTPDDANPCSDGDDVCTENDRCEGGVCVGDIRDRDVDGHGDHLCGGPDCDDQNPAVNPDAVEVCDTVDNDCDDLIDQRLCANQEGVCEGVLQQCSGGDFAPCDYAANPDFEWLETNCDSLDNDCDGCTDELCAGYAEPIVAAEVIPFSTGQGLRRISGNGQFGPIGAELPAPLVVQLNEDCAVPPCDPMPDELVFFAVEPAGAVCFGEVGTYDDCGPPLCPLDILQACNDTEGVLVGEAVARTDINGQASLRLQLNADEVGMTVVSATAAGQTVHFFAASPVGLADQIVVPTVSTSSPVNPALGPLGVTARPIGASADEYLGDIANYTLAITGLAADTGSYDGVPSAPLSAGGTLTISGAGFAGAGNQVWIGGVPATIVSESAIEIVVDIPEGLPGAAAVVVYDGTDTPFQSGVGDVPSIASASAHFFRLAPKPIFIFADTGTLDGSEAAVKLLGLDRCGNPLDLSGRPISLAAYDPGTLSPSAAVGVAAPDPSSGLATVAHLSDAVRSAVVVGTVGGISSDDLPDGNTVVSTVPNLLSPDEFTEDPVLGNDDGINSLIMRGGDESDLLDPLTLNPAIRFQMTILDAYPFPDATETEAHLLASTMIGEGDVTNIPGGGQSVTGGTMVAGVSGGEGGVMGVMAVTVGMDTLLGTLSFDVPPMVMSGWLRRDVRQELEFNYTGLLYLLEAREAIVRLLLQRPTP